MLPKPSERHTITLTLSIDYRFDVTNSRKCETGITGPVVDGYYAGLAKQNYLQNLIFKTFR